MGYSLVIQLTVSTTHHLRSGGQAQLRELRLVFTDVVVLGWRCACAAHLTDWQEVVPGSPVPCGWHPLPAEARGAPFSKRLFYHLFTRQSGAQTQRRLKADGRRRQYTSYRRAYAVSCGSNLKVGVQFMQLPFNAMTIEPYHA